MQEETTNRLISGISTKNQILYFIGVGRRIKFKTIDFALFFLLAGYATLFICSSQNYNIITLISNLGTASCLSVCIT